MNSRLTGEPGTDPARFFGLDVLRFVAVVIVMHTHTTMGFRPFQIFDFPTYSSFLPTGSSGVDLFFVLSGFLVSGLLFTELKQRGTMSLGRFFIRRAFKIYPCFWVLLFVTVLWRHHLSGSFLWGNLLPELFFYQNYVPGLWEHTWSLAVEEHFYLLLIGVFWLLKALAKTGEQMKIHLTPRAFEIAFVLCTLARIATWLYVAESGLNKHRWSMWTTHARVDALFFGMLLAYYWHLRWSETTKARLRSFNWLLLGGGVMLLSSGMQHQMNYDVWLLCRFILAYLGAGCLLLASLSLKASSAFGALRWMAWIGRHSYSIYLWHMLILDSLKPWAEPLATSLMTSAKIEAIYFIASCGCGIATARIIEFPMLRLRDRLFPSRSGGV